MKRSAVVCANPINALLQQIAYSQSAMRGAISAAACSSNRAKGSLSSAICGQPLCRAAILHASRAAFSFANGRSATAFDFLTSTINSDRVESRIASTSTLAGSPATSRGFHSGLPLCVVRTLEGALSSTSCRFDSVEMLIAVYCGFPPRAVICPTRDCLRDSFAA